MTELLTAAQMRAIERAAIESGTVTGLDLMERAGRGVVEAIFRQWPDLARAPHRALVLCGPGNNGGDGFVIARLLTEWCWEVEVALFGDPAKLPPDAKTNYRRWRTMGEVEDYGALTEEERDCDVIVDALFGTGMTRPFKAARPQEKTAAPSTRCVAVDLPTGIHTDTGATMATPFVADLTVTFHRPKLGHYLTDGPAWCGTVAIADIGLGPWMKDSGDMVRLACPAPTGKRAAAHKFTHGHALILSGGAGRTGAARLAARGALRIGAGLVTIGVPGSAQQEVAAQVTAVMLRRAGTPEETAEVLRDARLNAVCLGPGLGVERARAMVETVLESGGLASHPRRGVVLDADALTAFAEEPEALFKRLHDGCVLTPHGGEFRRLFPDLAEALAPSAETGPAISKVEAARAAALRAGCVVLFKGADTVIAAPDGTCHVHAAHYDRAVPWLATAGAGDVLAGFIVGLLARGFDPLQAAETAAWLHVECARRFGPGLIAEDLPETLPSVLRDSGI
ncbi:yjeF C-terminal region, hydroxyethylthiazole kinase-related/yjeF N-terminal region [Salinihabitans flavidus]|uniref:Bifunctional NAD(P)H-hydrate repair enzyme n=1 Tax=Salinihabitans flavidus TaxID=569882 RepID=A0A1H8RNK2_9RHOB|nr:NAD(P)H-hydrate dehydratase [Salinihabitans flavidus]SEO67553.1 yjeF C-terminal region, hydroxyethylthiazole kinase-related/yjeF N-terminal region [Salinihabitans flavidus]